MPKSNAVFLAISNFLLIYMVCLSTSGVGWEVSPGTMSLLSILSLLTSVLIFVNYLFIIINSGKFIEAYSSLRYVYIAYIIVSFLFFILVSVIGVFEGQFWFENFPVEMFFFVANAINIILLVLSLIGIRDSKKHGNRSNDIA